MATKIRTVPLMVLAVICDMIPLKNRVKSFIHLRLHFPTLFILTFEIQRVQTVEHGISLFKALKIFSPSILPDYISSRY